METNQSTPSRLLAYGSLALGSTTILATQADAATVVDVNSSTYDTGLSGIGTVSYKFDQFNYDDKAYVTFSRSVATNRQFLRGSDANTQGQPDGSGYQYEYGINGSASNGAKLNSSDNWFYVNAASDSSQRAWFQFRFGDADAVAEVGEFSIVKAVFLDEGDVINTAEAASTVSAVPEPSHMGALFALGASGILLSRRRQAV